MWVKAPLRYGVVQEIQVEQNTVALEKASRAAGIGHESWRPARPVRIGEEDRRGVAGG
jgi:hypothetical protein